MPFIQPCSTTRNHARYKTVDSTDDFVLQEHRYSLRKSRHLYWVRVITAHKPRFKVAHAVTEREIRAREWKFISEDLPRGLPANLRALSPGSAERTQWLLERLVQVKQQLGDEDDEDDYLEMFDEDEYEDIDNDGDVDEECKVSERDLDRDQNERYAQGGEQLEDGGFSGARAQRPQALGRHEPWRPRSEDLTSARAELAEGSTSPTNSQASVLPAGAISSPAVSGTKASRFNIVRHLRGRNASSNKGDPGFCASDSEASTFASPNVSAPKLRQRGASTRKSLAAAVAAASLSTEGEAAGRPAARVALQQGASSSHLVHRRTNSDTASASEYDSANEDGGERRVLRRQASTLSLDSTRVTPGGRNAKLLSASWMRNSLSNIGLGQLAGAIGIGDANHAVDGELPAYLRQPVYEAGGDGGAKSKREAVTMERLKREHERRSMAKGVAGVTVGAFVLRVVSFDAFLLLLVALNVAVCYGIHHRHALVKRFAKSSIKRRVKFTRQVWNARWGKSSSKTQPAAEPDGHGLAQPASTPSGSISAPGPKRVSLVRSSSQPTPLLTTPASAGGASFFADSPNDSDSALGGPLSLATPVALPPALGSPGLTRQSSTSRILKLMT